MIDSRNSCISLAVKGLQTGTKGMLDEGGQVIKHKSMKYFHNFNLELIIDFFPYVIKWAIC